MARLDVCVSYVAACPQMRWLPASLTRWPHRGKAMLRAVRKHLSPLQQAAPPMLSLVHQQVCCTAPCSGMCSKPVRILLRASAGDESQRYAPCFTFAALTFKCPQRALVATDAAAALAEAEAGGAADAASADGALAAEAPPATPADGSDSDGAPPDEASAAEPDATAAAADGEASGDADADNVAPPAPATDSGAQSAVLQAAAPDDAAANANEASDLGEDEEAEGDSAEADEEAAEEADEDAEAVLEAARPQVWHCLSPQRQSVYHLQRVSKCILPALLNTYRTML